MPHWIPGALERRAGRAGTADHPLRVSIHDLSVRADVHEQEHALAVERDVGG